MIDAYKRNVDRSLLRENLKRTVEERFRNLQAWQRFAAEWRRAGNPRARAVEFIPDAFVVHLEDGRSLTVPLTWFPRLRDATPEQRRNWRFIGPGTGIHWPEIDEDISVAGLLGLPD